MAKVDSMNVSRALFLTLLAVFAAPCCLRAAGDDLFETKIRPVLRQHCFACHSDKRAAGGLRLHTREAMLKGGDNGPAVVLGDPDKSLLIQTLSHDGKIKMPPSGVLKEQQIADFSAWIKQGAAWPEASGAAPSKPDAKKE
jgi:mono/diheme cytochrome c family protein